jgi:hypothetical protein
MKAENDVTKSGHEDYLCAMAIASSKLCAYFILTLQIERQTNVGIEILL